jgi:hypothetical protein
MGISVIEGREGSIYNDSRTFCFLFCNTSGIAFGPRFWDADEALAVEAHIRNRPRHVDDPKDARGMTADEIGVVAENLRQARGAEWWHSFDEYDRPIEQEDEDDA